MVPFEQILAVIKKQEEHMPGYDIRIDYLRSLYFYASLLPKDAIVIELGTLYGCSLVTMAAALRGKWSIIGIDPALGGTYHYEDQHQPQGYTFTSSYVRVLKLAEECGLDFNNANSPETGIINLYGSRSWDILEEFKLREEYRRTPWDLSMVLIDAEHSQEAIKKDLE